MKNILFYTVLFASFAAFAAEPYVGYLYPAGMKKGTTSQIIVGGQALWGNVKPLISDPGIKVLSVTVVPNFSNPTENQRRYLQKCLVHLMEGGTDLLPPPEEAEQEGWRTNPWWKKMDTLDTLSRSLVAKDLYLKRNALQATPSIQQLLIVELEVPDAVKAGEYSIRFFSGNGVSNVKRFFVDDAGHFNEPVFAPPAFAATNALPVIDTVPSIVNGQILPGETDRFIFHLKAKQDYTFSLCGRELQPLIGDAVPGHFQAVLRIVDTNGTEKAFADDDYNQVDPVLRFTPEQDGDYTLEVRDSLYRGRADFVYRVVTTEGTIPYCPRESAIVVPQTMHTMTADEAQPKILNAQESLVIIGTFSEKGHTDIFRVQAVKDEELVIEVFARRLDSPLDSRLRLRNPDGTLLAENDDANVELNIGSFVQNTDSYLRVKIPANGVYSIEFSDRIHGGDENYRYRLQIRHPAPDCTVYSAKSNLNIPENGAALTFYAVRTDGFDGPIKLLCDDWPIADNAEILAMQNSGTIRFKPSPTRTYLPKAIHLFAEFTVNGRTIKKAIVPADDIMQAFAYQHLLPAPDLVAFGINPPKNKKK